MICHIKGVVKSDLNCDHDTYWQSAPITLLAYADTYNNIANVGATDGDEDAQKQIRTFLPGGPPMASFKILYR